MSADDGHEVELTARQRAWVDAWFGPAKFNATKAAELAGFGNGSGNAGTWSNAGSRMLGNAKVRAEVERRWAQHGVMGEEVRARLTELMRGSMGDLLADEGVLMIDPKKVRPAAHLIKAFSWTKEGLRVELYSALEAAKLVGQSLGMFEEKSTVTVHTGKRLTGILEQIAAALRAGPG